MTYSNHREGQTNRQKSEGAVVVVAEEEELRKGEEEN